MEEKTSVNKTSKNDRDSMDGVYDFLKIMLAFTTLAVLNPHCSNYRKLGFDSDNWAFIWCIIWFCLLGSVSAYLKYKKKIINEKRQDEAKDKSHN